MKQSSSLVQLLTWLGELTKVGENREERMHDYILLMSEVKSRINLLTDAEFLNKKQTTNLGMMSDKVPLDERSGR